MRWFSFPSINAFYHTQRTPELINNVQVVSFPFLVVIFSDLLYCTFILIFDKVIVFAFFFLLFTKDNFKWIKM